MYSIYCNDPGAYSLVRLSDMRCFMLMVNSIQTSTSNVQITVCEVRSVDSQKYVEALREVYKVEYFVSAWDHVVKVIQAMLHCIMTASVDLEDPRLLALEFGGLANDIDYTIQEPKQWIQ